MSSRANDAAILIGGLLLGAIFGFAAFVLALSWSTVGALVLAIAGPPLSIRLVYRAGSAVVPAAYFLAVSAALAVMWIGASGFES